MKNREKQKYVEKGARVEKVFRDELAWIQGEWSRQQGDREATRSLVNKMCALVKAVEA